MADSGDLMVAVIVATPPTLVAAAAWYVARQNSAKAEAARLAALAAAEHATEAAVLAAAAKADIVQTKDGVFELGKRVDGRLEELLQTTREAATAAGLAAGIAQERASPQSPRAPEDTTRALGFQMGRTFERYQPGEDDP